jgi:hypothetical protein
LKTYSLANRNRIVVILLTNMGILVDASTIAKPFRDEVKNAVQRLKDSGLGR